jgi:carboxymethylenebutenolidase
MCFDHDSRPPIRSIAGGALDSRDVTLTASDGNRLSAFEVRAASPSGNRILILPDIRGLHEYYVELAMRFAERGIDAVAIDWFGRTAGLGRRAEGFDYMPHVNETTWPAIAADIAAGAAHARSIRSAGDTGGTRPSLFTIGFCFGGRNAFLSGTLGLGLAGAIGFYGSPVGPGRGGSPAPADLAAEIASPVLGLFGGADGSIPPEAVAAFDEALTRAGVEHELRSYPGAPHSFFDRKADQFADESADAWERVLAFIAGHAAPAATE